MRTKEDEIQREKNKVHFIEQRENQIRSSDQNSILELKQKTIKNIATLENRNISKQASYVWDSEAVKEKLLKFINFVKFHKVEQELIWKKKKELSITQFANSMNQNYGYYLQNFQLAALMKLSTRKESLRAKDFELLGLWIHQNDTSKFNLYVQNKSSQTNKKNNLQKFKNSKTLKIQSNWLQNQAEQYLQNSQYVTIKPTDTSKESINPIKQFSAQSFIQAKKYSQAKVKLKVQELKKDIKQSVLEKKWDFIVMAGQINQWIEQLKKQNEKQSSRISNESLFSYRFKVLNKNPVQIIRHNICLNSQQLIPHVVFIKKYQTLKKRMVKQQNNKNNLKGTVLMVLQDCDKFSKNNLINRINQRDQQLNFVLLQIMRMKSLFQWQNNILREAKINY